jgi:hypothetical protein
LIVQKIVLASALSVAIILTLSPRPVAQSGTAAAPPPVEGDAAFLDIDHF